MPTGALEGLRVLDLTSYVAGPYGCALLGDMGADVIKVEAPNGDMMRHYPSTLPGESRAFLGVNRNKRSIVINLKAPSGRDVLYRLARSADVFVHNFRPSVPESLGVGYQDILGVRGDIIYCALTGYGDGGPLRDHPGFDQLVQSFTGIADFQGAPSGAPQVVLGSIVDYFASTLLAFGVASAVVHRLKTGEGQFVDVSLLRAAIAMQASRFIWAENEPRDVSRDLSAGRLTGIHPTKEGHIYIQAHTPPFWNALCGFLGLPHLAENPRYDDMKKRKEYADEILPAMHEALKTRSAAEWEEMMLGKVPCLAVRSIGDMFDHPQVVAQSIVTEEEHPSVGRYRTMTKAVQMGAFKGRESTKRAPLLGENTDAILLEADFSAADIEKLRSEGTVA